jgi:DNA-binding MarR family transcriptional regulator
MSKLPFGFEQPEDSPGFLLWQTTVIWQRRIKKALEAYSISHPQFVLMALLLWLNYHYEDVPNQATLVKLSKLDKMTVSQALKRLVMQDLVKRAEHADDTRAKGVWLTEQGKILIQKLVPIIEKIDAEFFGVLPLPQQQSLLHFLQTLSQIQEG